MLIGLILGLIPFLVGLVIGRWWALVLVAGATSLYVAAGAHFDEYSFSPDAMWHLRVRGYVIVTIYFAFPAAVWAATGVGVRLVALRAWANWHSKARSFR